jgi:PAS domain S-box-containing protein
VAALVGAADFQEGGRRLTGSILLTASILLQLLAAGLALRPTRLAGRFGFWNWFAAALALMALRRGVTLWDLLQGANLERLDAAAEWIALVISILMVVGVAGIGPLLIRMQTALAERAEWRRTFDAVPDMICLLDRDHHVVRANRAFLERFGDGTEAILGRKCHECVHGTRGPAEFCPHAQTIRDGGEHTVEAFDPRLNAHLRITTAPVVDEAGRPAGSVHVARDVTRRKEMEEALRESERKFRLIAEKTSDGLFLFENGAITYASPAYNRMMGYASGEIAGRTEAGILERLHPDDRERVAAMIGEARKNRRERLVYRFRARRNDGEYIWREDHATLMYDDDGELARAYVVARDVTEPVRAEAELRESRAALDRELDFSRRILNSTDAHMAVVGADGRILEVNEAWRRFARENHGGDEASWGPGANYFHACAYDPGAAEEPDAAGGIASGVEDGDGESANRGRACRGIRDVQTGQDSFFEMEYPCHGPDRERWFVMRVLPLAGRPGTVLISHVDVTRRVVAEAEREAAHRERLEMERRMQHAQKLESLGVLASGIAHDFNNMLMAIMGNAELARMDLPEGAPASQSVMDIERAARRAAELCGQMLAYSGRGRFVIEAFDVHALIREMADLLKTSVSKKAGLSLQLADGPGWIEGDATQIRQVIMNLVINASDALEGAPGRIDIRSRVRELDGGALSGGLPMDPLPPGRYVEISVIDTGCGMAAETVERLFEPFFTTKTAGRGLGMASVLGIVNGHRGKLRLHSVPGAGTTFQVILPVAGDAASAHVPAPPPDRSWRGEGTILLVDDEAEVRALTGKMLTRLGFQVQVAADGREALQRYAESGPFDLVLLDLSMPRMDGVETYRALARDDPNARVVVCSGYSAREIVGQFPGDNFLGVLEKPYNMAALEARMRRVFG